MLNINQQFILLSVKCFWNLWSELVIYPQLRSSCCGVGETIKTFFYFIQPQLILEINRNFSKQQPISHQISEHSFTVEKSGKSTDRLIQSLSHLLLKCFQYRFKLYSLQWVGCNTATVALTHNYSCNNIPFLSHCYPNSELNGDIWFNHQNSEITQILNNLKILWFCSFAIVWYLLHQWTVSGW